MGMKQKAEAKKGLAVKRRQLTQAERRNGIARKLRRFPKTLLILSYECRPLERFLIVKKYPFCGKK